jgi:hypothetical protein
MHGVSILIRRILCAASVGVAGKPVPTRGPRLSVVSSVPSFPSSGLGTASWESKLELLHSCVPKLELGNKVEHEAGEPGIKEGRGGGRLTTLGGIVKTDFTAPQGVLTLFVHRTNNDGCQAKETKMENTIQKDAFLDFLKGIDITAEGFGTRDTSKSKGNGTQMTETGNASNGDAEKAEKAREEKLERWMSDIKHFIRNINVDQL